MNKLIPILLSASLYGEVIPYSVYIPTNNISYHLTAGKKEFSAFVQKMSAKVKEEPIKNISKRAVLLVHGLNSSPKDWHMLFADLKANGYEVYTIYLSYWKKDGFNESVRKIQEKALSILQDHPTIDIIGHSLGGLASVQAVNHLGDQQRKVTRLITINSPLNGTTILNRFTALFIPDHLVEVLTPNTPFAEALREQSVKTAKAGVRFYHTAAESDHLVREIDACVLPSFHEAVVVTEEGHLSTLNCGAVREKILAWLK